MEKKEFLGIEYGIWKPQGYCETKKYPIIFYTHGAGSRGKDLSILEQNPIIKHLTLKQTNAIIVAPHCSEDSWFDVFERLIRLLQNIYEMPTTDKNRFYGIGASMGGYTMFQLMESQPEIFTAGIICCGGGMYWNAGRLKHIPIRLFHGECDTVVYPEESKRMYEKINEKGGTAHLTLYPDCDHNCWDKTFSNVENIEWLLSIKKDISKRHYR